MTDDLIKRLWENDNEIYLPILGEAAHRISDLQMALGWFVNDTRFVVQVGGNPNVVPGMIDAATKIYFGDPE